MMSLPDASQGYAVGAIPAQVDFTGRFKRGLGPDWACLGLFIIGVLSYLAIGFMLVAGANVEISAEEGIVLSDDLILEQNDCAATTGRLLQFSANQCQDLWCLFAKDPEIPVITIMLVPVIATIWIVSLYMFTHAIVWASVIFNALIYALIGIALLMEDLGDYTVAYLLLAFSGVLFAIIVYTRKQITRAAHHLRTACMALGKNKSVFIATGLIEFLVIGTITVHWFFLVAAGKNAEVDPITCEVVLFPESVFKMTQFLSIFLLWIVAYFNSAKLITTAMTVGTWFFGQENKPKMHAFSAMKSSLTSSAGANSMGGLITAAVEAIVREATSHFWWSNPAGCIMKMFLIIAQGCIMALTRFATISHAFTGEDFFGSSKRAFAVLKRNFVGGYVLSRVGVSVVRTGANALSLCFGLLAWYWIDQENNFNTLEDVTSVFGGLIGFLAFIFVYLMLIKRPLITIFAITMVMNLITGFVLDPAIFAPIGGVFVSCVAAIILNFQGDVILDALDTIFMAYAVSNEGGLEKPSSDGRGEVYKLMEDVPEAIKVQQVQTAQAVEA